MFHLAATNRLVEEIAQRMKRGDAAAELVTRLLAQTKIISRFVARLGDGIPEKCREELSRLHNAVQNAVMVGDRWLAESAGPELAAQTLKRRISRAYGLITHYN